MNFERKKVNFSRRMSRFQKMCLSRVLLFTLLTFLLQPAASKPVEHYRYICGPHSGQKCSSSYHLFFLICSIKGSTAQQFFPSKKRDVIDLSSDLFCWMYLRSLPLFSFFRNLSLILFLRIVILKLSQHSHISKRMYRPRQNFTWFFGTPCMSV